MVRMRESEAQIDFRGKTSCQFDRSGLVESATCKQVEPSTETTLPASAVYRLATRVADLYGIWLKPGRSRRQRERSSDPRPPTKTNLTRDDTTDQRTVNAAISPGQKFVTRSFLVTISNRYRDVVGAEPCRTLVDRLTNHLDERPFESPSIVHN